MDTPVYNPTGNYLIYASVIVAVIVKIWPGFPFDVQTIALILTAITALVGNVMSHSSNKQMAVALGSIKK